MEPGLKEVLGLLKPGFGLAVATNRSTTIEKVLTSNGLAHFFDIVISTRDVTKPKPHPESLFKILVFFEARPVAALYVGDSSVDSETAHAAGVPFVSYRNSDLNATYHIDHLMEIATILGLDNPGLI